MLAALAAAGAKRPVKPLVLLLSPAPAPPSKKYRLQSLPVTETCSFPPAGVAYRENATAHRIFRAIHALAPSLVVDPAGLPGLRQSLEGKVPVVAALPAALDAALDKDAPPLSHLARALAEQLSRTPRQVAVQLAEHYGHALTGPTYIEALACMARLRLGALGDIEQLAAHAKPLAKPNATVLAGHLLFAELATQTGKAVYKDRLIDAADLALQPDGNQMSDFVFMACPLLGQAAKLTGDARYRTKAVEHLRLMESLCLRADGLYRHSPLCDAPWGRGNAFPALGMALLLETMPAPDPHVLASFRKLIGTLAPYQSPEGLWRQLIDEPDTWPEFSCTAMIGTAVLKGIRGKWLDARRYRSLADKAWQAIQTRTATDGTVMDVCESTGKQPTAGHYRNRAALWDKDPRGGAMAMLFATERMLL